MKIFCSLLITSYLFFLSYFAHSQADKNNIIKTLPLIQTQSEAAIDNLPLSSKNITINFVSETGHLIQTKSNSRQPNGKFLVRNYEYDSSLRLIKEYEPAIDNSGTPTFIENFEILTTNTYSGANNICQNNYPYSEFEYENSPLNSLLKSSSPGDSWVMSGSHTSRQKQLVATTDDHVMNLYYDGSIKQSLIPIPNEAGNSNITHSFSSSSQFQGLVELNTNHVSNGEIIYRGGEQLWGSNKNLISFSGLNPSSFYFLRYKIAKEGESSAIIVGIKGLSSSTNSTLTNINGSALEHSAGTLSDSFTLFESSIITGVDEILFTTYGPVGTFSDAIKIDDIEILELSSSEISPYYNNNSLFIEEIIDPDNLVTRVFYNSLGLKILERKSNSGLNLDTYYVYDNYLQLRAVIPPSASHLLNSNFEENINLIEDLIFYYEYDGRGLIKSKKVPQKEIEYFIYDKSGNLILSQDGNLRNENKWRYQKYDINKRPIIMGILSSELPVNELILSCDFGGMMGNFYESRNSTSTSGYSNTIFPTTDTQLDVLTFYDFYPTGAHENNENYETRIIGQITFKKEKVINGDPGTELFINKTYYYDNKARIIKQYESGINSMNQEVKRQYSWAGDLLAEEIKTTIAGIEYNETFEYSYYRPGVLRKCDYQINDENKVILFVEQYNELGQKIKTSLFRDNNVSSNYLQNINYSYNQRGWLKRINNSSLFIDEWNNDTDDTFGEELFYDEDLSGVHPYTPRFNGNISALKWKGKAANVDAGLVAENVYSFQYDEFDRLLHASYASSTLLNNLIFNSNQGFFDEEINYDFNGNITLLKRKNQNILIDNLNYIYRENSNLLEQVTEGGSNFSFGNFKNFVQSSQGNIAYEYDSNGNLTKDFNKGLIFEYNNLNTISKVKRIDDVGEPVLNPGGPNFNSEVKYAYSASGQRLLKRTPTNETYYFNRFEDDMNNGISISIPNGRVRKELNGSEENWFFDFFITDYLGNVRAIITNENAPVSKTVLTMEPSRMEEEESDFYNVPPSRRMKPISMPEDNTYGINTKVSELKSNENNGAGPGRMVPVKAGDLIELSTKYWFEDITVQNNQNLTLTQIIQGVAGSIVSNAEGVVNGFERLTLGYTDVNSPQYTNLSNTLSSLFSNIDLQKPQAFLVYLSFDKNLNVIGEPYSGQYQVSLANELGTLVKDQFKVVKDGYFHAYLVNASTKPVNFDDMTVRIIKANTVQIMDYYPFGLMWEKQDVTSTDNLKWHHGKELQENEFAQQGKSLDLEDFGARMFDPILGRWWSVDPLAEKFLSLSPFNGMGNNPIFFIDPDGMEIIEHERGKHTVYNGNDAAMALAALQAGEEEKIQQQDTDPVKPKIGLSATNPKPFLFLSTYGNSSGFQMPIEYTANDAKDAASVFGHVDLGISSLQIALLNYRKSLPLHSKISNSSNFLSKYSTLSSLRSVPGKLANIGSALEFGLNYNDYKDKKISSERFFYRSTGILASMGASTVVGAEFGGPYGAVAGFLVSGTFGSAEIMYDGYKAWQQQMSIYLTNLENALSRGWTPGR